ncbi:hypothetical protein LLO_p4099 (plasmid) [Legionella longbeachae NSW150]|uniref:Uncharacterized protein n=1 Tax=Legionella longbeachae serogroup 1 (strain NSW150) TaxID=661367 RepID=D3HTW4_LEGLN|nr:hypothetical protein LLO_p4099 [Legionella longbeachae NSW150]
MNINGLKLKTFVELLIVLLMSYFVSIVYNQFIVTRLYCVGEVKNFYLSP